MTVEKTETIEETASGRYDLEIVENSYLWSETFPYWLDAQEGVSYTPLKETVSAEGYIKVTEFTIPDQINGFDVNRIVGFIDGDRCVVKVAADKDEIGVINYFTQEYKTLFTCDILMDQDADFYFYDYCNGRMLLGSSAPGMDCIYHNKLWIYDFNSQSIRNIYTYNVEDDNGKSILMEDDYVMLEEGIYFADGFIGGEGNAPYYANLYFYNFEKESVELIKEFAINPIRYGESYACFIGDASTTQYNTLVDSEGNVLWQVDEYGIDIKGNEKDIYIVCVANDDDMMVTRTGIMNLAGDYLFTTYRRCGLSDVTKRSVLPSIDCLNEEYPFLYDIDLDKIVYLDNMPKCTHFTYENVSEDGSKLVLKVNHFSKWYLLEFLN